jgi:HSP20 family protein
MIQIVRKSGADKDEMYGARNKAGQASSSSINWRIEIYPQAWRPPTDVIETNEMIIIRVEIAGMNEDDFKITLLNNQVHIRGIRKDELKKQAYHLMEIPFGEFDTRVEITVPIDDENVNAKYENGFLSIYLPIVEKRKIIIHKG